MFHTWNASVRSNNGGVLSHASFVVVAGTVQGAAKAALQLARDNAPGVIHTATVIKPTTCEW